MNANISVPSHATTNSLPDLKPAFSRADLQHMPERYVRLLAKIRDLYRKPVFEKGYRWTALQLDRFAEQLGVHRTTVSRMLRRLAEMGIVAILRKRFFRSTRVLVRFVWADDPTEQAASRHKVVRMHGECTVKPGDYADLLTREIVAKLARELGQKSGENRSLFCPEMHGECTVKRGSYIISYKRKIKREKKEGVSGRYSFPETCRKFSGKIPGVDAGGNSFLKRKSPLPPKPPLPQPEVARLFGLVRAAIDGVFGFSVDGSFPGEYQSPCNHTSEQDDMPARPKSFQKKPARDRAPRIRKRGLSSGPVKLNTKPLSTEDLIANLSKHDPRKVPVRELAYLWRDWHSGAQTGYVDADDPKTLKHLAILRDRVADAGYHIADDFERIIDAWRKVRTPQTGMKDQPWCLLRCLDAIFKRFETETKEAELHPKFGEYLSFDLAGLEPKGGFPDWYPEAKAYAATLESWKGIL